MTAARSQNMKTTSNKTVLFLGLLFIVSSFLCVVAVFYQVVNNWQENSRQLEIVLRRLAESEAGQAAARSEAQHLAHRMGRGIEFESLMAASRQHHGFEERTRRQGDLWIDRQGDQWMVTLGALNGLREGSLLRVMDGTQEVGMVAVKTVLDVVSYVSPLDNRDLFQDDIYHVVVEE